MLEQSQSSTIVDVGSKLNYDRLSLIMMECHRATQVKDVRFDALDQLIIDLRFVQDFLLPFPNEIVVFGDAMSEEIHHHRRH
jgi:hypothetical protein